MQIDIQKNIARDGNESLIINGLFIHSKFKPIEEAKNIAQKLYHPHHLHVVYGYGLGYVVEELVGKCKFNEPILVIDPLLDEGILEKIESHYTRIYYVQHDNIPLMENIVSKLTSYSHKVKVYIQQNYKEIFPENLMKVLEVVKNAQIREIYNVNTIHYFSMQWQINTFMNMENIKKDESVSTLYNNFDCPIVIASGGPSLTKQLPLIKEYRDKIVLICAGTTINTLLNAGIAPDYVVTIDGGEVNYNHFKDLHLNDSKIIYAPSSHYKIRDSFNKRGYVFVSSSARSLQSYYERKINTIFPQVFGGGSVAHYAFSLAKKFTSGPICLVGQDLAYTNDLSHAEGNKNSKNISMETQPIVQVEGYEGGKIKSSDSFVAMIHTFEQLQLADPHKNKVFNCTEGGAKIKLIEQLPFEDFLKLYAKNQVSYEALGADSSTKEDIQQKEFVQNEIKNYFSIIDLLDSGIKLTEKEKGPLFNQSTLKKLSKIDKKLNDLYIENNVDALLEPIIYSNELRFLPELKESKSEEFNRVKEYTISLYKDCKGRILEFIEKINEVMEEENCE